MNIRLLPSGEVVLEEAAEFRRFAVLVPAGTDPATSPLAGLMPVEGGHAWVPRATLLALHPGADADWLQRLDAMAAYAAGKGWTDAEGRIRAHIEHS